MIPVLLIALGIVLAFVGVAVSVGSATADGFELYRWVAGRLPGADAAKALLGAPSTVARGASGITAVGVLVAALGVWVALARLPAPLMVIGLVLVVVPVFLALSYAAGRAAGRRWPEPLVRGVVPWVNRLARVLAPVKSPVPPRGDGVWLAEDELADRLGRHELRTVSGVLDFAERPVRDVMTPRTDLVAVRDGASLEEIARALADSPDARIPVYGESLDDVTGMIYAFDLLKVPPGAALPVRPVATAPASKPCGDLLFQLQRDRQQLAVVLDEYGGTAGVVTFDDLVQELADGIVQASGAVRPAPPPLEVVEVSGATPLADIATRFDVAITAEAETISGVLARAVGRIPASGERFALGGLEFDILQASATRVERVAVRRGSVPVINLTRAAE